MLCKFYAPTEYNLDALLNEYFWFSKQENLNDPFDLAGVHSLRNNLDYNALIDNLVSKYTTVDKKYIKTASHDYALCSFSQNPINRLMWAHYAKEYTGWCLVFYSNTTYCKNPHIHLQDTIYVNSKYKIESSFPPIGKGRNKKEQLLNIVLRIKHSDWMYENEKRMLVKCTKSSQRHGIRQYWNDNILIGVVLGTRISPAYESLIRKIISDKNKIHPKHHILCYKISKDVSNFSLHWR